MRVEFSKFVEGDLDAIADYIAQDNPIRAVSFIGIAGALEAARRPTNPELLVLQATAEPRSALTGEGARPRPISSYTIYCSRLSGRGATDAACA